MSICPFTPASCLQQGCDGAEPRLAIRIGAEPDLTASEHKSPPPATVQPLGMRQQPGRTRVNAGERRGDPGRKATRFQ